MTLALAAVGKKSIWLVTDRRLTFGDGTYTDDAVKQISLEAPDGFALLGYAGLGLTALGNEPSQWMSNTLRGRNGSLEQMLGVLADSARVQLPKHLDMIGSPHAVIIPAFVDGEPRLYSIELIPDAVLATPPFAFRRIVNNPTEEQKHWVAPAITMTGSGRFELRDNRDWANKLLKLIEATEAGDIPQTQVERFLAGLNNDVAARDVSVGPQCIVSWRLQDKTGGITYFTGTKEDSNSPGIPSIANGGDSAALIGALLPHMRQVLEAMSRGEKHEFDTEAVNNELKNLPRHPDDKLD